jgi:hypothetical protein
MPVLCLLTFTTGGGRDQSFSCAAGRSRLPRYIHDAEAHVSLGLYAVDTCRGNERAVPSFGFRITPGVFKASPVWSFTWPCARTSRAPTSTNVAICVRI